jgi:hypothetical protein
MTKVGGVLYREAGSPRNAMDGAAQQHCVLEMLDAYHWPSERSVVR